MVNLKEVIKVSIAEFLDVEIHRDTGNLDFASKIEIVQKRIGDKIKNKQNSLGDLNTLNKYEYEMFFSSNPNDMIKIDGWVPIETSNIGRVEKISEYIEIGLLRKIKPLYN
ncbi:hypothetical protein [Aquimarina sp. 2201CG14-23]|uniref:hypothetical protein n=1 Tax=Aquimarina mycalae TaxID=3040073 RepID=UPI002478191D|nr:hypothetical protein [Aquimarina sp. 2201CG14-23]MDH7444181.1 hypothetical protein [Aquimarina sp. 2201CG14-23]